MAIGGDTGTSSTTCRPEQFSLRARVERSDGAINTFDYDPYFVAVTTATDTLGHPLVSVIDYNTLAAVRITDVNGRVNEERYDPLGVTIAATMYGQVDGQSWGFAPLAAVPPVSPADADEVLADPGVHIGDAARFVFYDLDAWARDGTPPVLVTLAREQLLHDGEGDGESGGGVATVVAYLDGMRRVLQQKTEVEAGAAIARDGTGQVVVDSAGQPVLQHSDRRWRASGHVVFDAKQRAVQQYEPFFSPTSAYEGDAILERIGVATLNRYDAIGRIVGQDFPNGTFTSVSYHAWSLDRADANDTVLTSAYQAQRQGLPAGDPERQALDAATMHADTPVTTYFDAIGRQIGGLARGGTTAADRRTAFHLAAEGHVLEAIDARGLTAFAYRYDMRGMRVSERSNDAGARTTLVDAHGRVAFAWNDRNLEIEHGWDVAGRPLYTHVRGGDGSTPLDHRVSEWEYGESRPVADAAQANQLGRAIRVRDTAGEAIVDRYDPAGQVLSASRRLRSDVDDRPDWRGVVPLDGETFTTGVLYDALGRAVREQLPDGTTRVHTYLPGGPLATTTISSSDGKLQNEIILAGSSYDARMQREQLLLGNGVDIEYRYDPATYRLADQTAQLGSRLLQGLRYTFDPMGNLVRLVDDAQDGSAAIIAGSSASSRRDYTYDAHYRVLTATGRVHQALLQYDFVPNTGGTIKGTRHLSFNNGAAIESYTQRFSYDAGGNLTSLQHTGTSRSWTTDFWVSPTSNRSIPALDLNGNPVPNPESRFDASGNLRQVAHLRVMEWTWRGALGRAVIVQRPGGTDDDERYAYSADGQRSRKVTTRVINGGVVEVEEKLYFGGCERKRIRRGATILLERWTSHIGDGTQRIATIHRWTSDQLGREIDDVTRAQLRYQLNTHQGSAALEIDGDGNLISYEEYFPYGGTAFLAGDDVREVELKDYRYSGKECDDATGLYYYGYRYYAPWMCRWLSPDPLGTVDGLNLYQFVLGNPVVNVDPAGLQTSGSAGQEQQVNHIAITSIPEWARPLWQSLTPDQRLDALSPEGTHAIVIIDGQPRYMDRQEALDALSHQAVVDVYDPVVPDAPGDQSGAGGGGDPDDPSVTTYDFSDDGDIIVVNPHEAGTGGGDNGGGGRAGHRSQRQSSSGAGAGGSRRHATGSGRGGGTRGNGTGRRGRDATRPADGSSSTATSASPSPSPSASGNGSGAGSGSGQGSGNGQGPAHTPTGASSAQPPGNGRQPGDGPSTTPSGNPPNNPPSGNPPSGGGTPPNPSLNRPPNGSPGGVAGGTGTAPPSPNQGTGRHTTSSNGGQSGTGTDAGGSTDPNLTPSATGQTPPPGVTRNGDEPDGSVNGSPDGRLGGREGGRPGGSLNGTPQGTHTDGTPDGSPQGQSWGSPDGNPQAPPPDALDALTRVAALANFESPMGDANGQWRGVPGGHGKHNLGAFGQIAYIALTVLSWLGPEAIVKGFSAVPKLLSRGASFASRLAGSVESRIASAVVRDVEEAAAKRVLVVGENGSFEYAANLARQNPELEVVASSYGEHARPSFPDIPNLEVHPTSVDATRLGDHFEPNSFDDIVFNGPRNDIPGVNWRRASGDLVDDTLKSAPDVLRPGGEVRFGAGGNMPSVPRLNSHVGGGTPEFPIPEGWGAPDRVPFNSDPVFGVPYTPRNSAGDPLRLTVDDLSWYIFGRQ